MKKQLLIGIASVVTMSGSVFAAGFTDLTGTSGFNDFGGTGIDATQSVVTQDSTDGILLGLTATLYHVPTPPNQMPGNAATSTFSATAGYSTFNATHATWNFDYFISGPSVGGFTYQLLYQLTPSSALVSVPLTLTAGVVQDSSALSFLSGFNANTTGVYTFELEALNANNAVVATDTIHVDVENAPEISSTAWMFALTLGGIGVYSRTRRQSIA